MSSHLTIVLKCIIVHYIFTGIVNMYGLLTFMNKTHSLFSLIYNGRFLKMATIPQIDSKTCDPLWPFILCANEIYEYLLQNMYILFGFSTIQILYNLINGGENVKELFQINITRSQFFDWHHLFNNEYTMSIKATKTKKTKCLTLWSLLHLLIAWKLWVLGHLVTEFRSRRYDSPQYISLFVGNPLATLVFSSKWTCHEDCRGFVVGANKLFMKP